ncbi:MAG: type II toxin-antitoxin system RelE/ParE family toxin [Verrucomicrobiales bacterium]|nr:type II toxin-antitoxin system RelE/ParE family toxin [Verrucomicrobiales bacterium]
MHQLEFHKRALKTLRKIPKDRAGQIVAKLEEFTEWTDPTEHPDVKVMRGEWEGAWRLRIGEYRAIFELSEIEGEEVALLIYVTKIGTRGDIY